MKWSNGTEDDLRWRMGKRVGLPNNAKAMVAWTDEALGELERRLTAKLEAMEARLQVPSGWTQDVPTEQGWWWYRDTREEDEFGFKPSREAWPCFVMKAQAGFLYWVKGETLSEARCEAAEWARMPASPEVSPCE